MTITVEKICEYNLIKNTLKNEVPFYNVDSTITFPDGSEKTVKEIMVELQLDSTSVSTYGAYKISSFYDMPDESRQAIFAYLDANHIEYNPSPEYPVQLFDYDAYQIDDDTQWEEYDHLCNKDFPRIFSYKNTWGINCMLNGKVPVDGIFPYSKEPDCNDLVDDMVTYMGKIDSDNLILEVFKVHVYHDVLYGFVGGFGTDGGFGDYAPPYFGDMICDEGEPILVKTHDEAQQVVKEINDYYADKFYSVGEHFTYDGEFPYEIKSVMLPAGNLAVRTGEETKEFFKSIR